MTVFRRPAAFTFEIAGTCGVKKHLKRDVALVFFSVCTYGLCAVYAPEGDNEIVFSYQTPGLKAGIILNCAGLGIYIIYLLLILKKKVKI